MQSFGERLDELRPPPSSDPPDEDLVRALASTKPLMVEFAMLAEDIAVHDSRDAAKALFEGLEHVLAGYDVRRGFVGALRSERYWNPMTVRLTRSESSCS
jgi:hypothetical protein